MVKDGFHVLPLSYLFGATNNNSWSPQLVDSVHIYIYINIYIFDLLKLYICVYECTLCFFPWMCCIVAFPTIKYRTQPASCFLSKTLRTQSGHNFDMFESREKTLRMALILHFRVSFPDIHTYCPDNSSFYSYISIYNICIPMISLCSQWSPS
jgi:hypothetical protein